MPLKLILPITPRPPAQLGIPYFPKHLLSATHLVVEQVFGKIAVGDR